MIVRLSSIFLIIAIISTSFTRMVIYAGYAINKAYIAKVLCENKAKPVMNCKGKCFLQKKIKQAEETEKQQGTSYAKSNLEILLSQNFNFRCYIFQTAEYLIPDHPSYLFSPPYTIFQPPRFYI